MCWRHAMAANILQRPAENRICRGIQVILNNAILELASIYIQITFICTSEIEGCQNNSRNQFFSLGLQIVSEGYIKIFDLPEQHLTIVLE